MSTPRFTPHPLIRSADLQTILGAYLWRQRPYQAQRVELTLNDGDRLVLHDDCPQVWQAGGPIALMLHGLAGCHGSGYMQRISAKLNRVGIRTFRMDQRGCGAGEGLARLSTHAGRTEDVIAVAEHLRRLAPESPITGIGFSLGAAILLKLMGRLGDAGPHYFSSAIAVSAPLDLAACSRNLARVRNRLYDGSFVRRLLTTLKRRDRKGAELHHVPLPRRPKTLYEFDELYTAAMGGFDGVEHYYQASSSGPDLKHIRVPTYLLHAEDDPLIPVECYHSAELSAVTKLHLTEHGGHLGFLGSPASPDPDWHWMDWRVIEWALGRAIENNDAGNARDVRC